MRNGQKLDLLLLTNFWECADFFCSDLRMNGSKIMRQFVANFCAKSISIVFLITINVKYGEEFFWLVIQISFWEVELLWASGNRNRIGKKTV